MVMDQARKELKRQEDEHFSVFDDIPKELYEIRKSQMKKFKEARGKGCTVYFSKAQPDRLFAWFDTVMSMDKQINSICQSVFYHLRNIAQISKRISFCHCETLIHAFVTSKIDDYNIILSGLRQDQEEAF